MPISTKYEVKYDFTIPKQPGAKYATRGEETTVVRYKTDVAKIIRKIKRAHAGVTIEITKVERTWMHETDFHGKNKNS